jgi:hypothetical protein
MDQELERRIDTLYDLGVIDSEVRDATRKAVERLGRFGFPITEDALGMLATHLAMCFERATSDDIVPAIGTQIRDEISTNSHFKEAMQITKRVMDASNYAVPDAERWLVVAHVEALIERFGSRAGDTI